MMKEWLSEFLQKDAFPQNLIPAIFQGFCCVVRDPFHIVQLYQLGCFGKGSLSKSYPKYAEVDCESLLSLLENCVKSHHPKELRKEFSSQDDLTVDDIQASLCQDCVTRSPYYITSQRQLYRSQKNLTSRQKKKQKTSNQPSTQALLDQISLSSVPLPGQTFSLLSEELNLSLEESFYLYNELNILKITVDTSKFPTPISSDGENRDSIVNENLSFTGESNSSLQLYGLFQHYFPRFPVLFSAYKFFRYRGWIVRGNGSAGKLGTDAALYRNCPSMVHAEYIYIVIPVYVDSQAAQSSLIKPPHQDQGQPMIFSITSSENDITRDKLSQFLADHQLQTLLPGIDVGVDPLRDTNDISLDPSTLLRTAGSVSKKMIIVFVHYTGAMDGENRGVVIPFDMLDTVTIKTHIISRYFP